MTNPRAFLVSVTLAVLATHCSCSLAQEAPFGFHWGDPLTALPKPSEAVREQNISALLYKRDRVPKNLGDTEEITLKVCDQEGLQQVIWVSELLSGEDARRKFASAYAEGARRYGEADEGDPAHGTASWNAARITMFAKLTEPGFYRFILIQDGPAFHDCAKEGEKYSIFPSCTLRVAAADSIPSYMVRRRRRD